MSKAVRRLGRGLDSLIGNLVGNELQQVETPPDQLVSRETSDARGPVRLVSRETAPRETVANPSESESGQSRLGFLMVPVDSVIQNKLQPRTHFEDRALLSLVESVRRNGILQPIVVRIREGIATERRSGEATKGTDEATKRRSDVATGRRDEGTGVRRHEGKETIRHEGTKGQRPEETESGVWYEIVAGERRYRAARMLGWKEVPVLVREATDEQMLELALIENLQREDLNAIDRAGAYRQFCERFRLSAENVALRLNEDRTTVVNYLRLLELPEGVQGMVATGRLGMGHARAILSEPNGVRRERLAQAAVEKELSVRAIEEIVRAGRAASETRNWKPETRTKDQVRSAHLRDMERRFEEALKTRVVIKEGRKKGAGKIVIEYFTLDDFDRVADLLGISSE